MRITVRWAGADVEVEMADRGKTYQGQSRKIGRIDSGTFGAISLIEVGDTGARWIADVSLPEFVGDGGLSEHGSTAQEALDALDERRIALIKWATGVTS